MRIMQTTCYDCCHWLLVHWLACVCIECQSGQAQCAPLDAPVVSSLRDQPIRFQVAESIVSSLVPVVSLHKDVETNSCTCAHVCAASVTEAWCRSRGATVVGQWEQLSLQCLLGFVSASRPAQGYLQSRDPDKNGLLVLSRSATSSAACTSMQQTSCTQAWTEGTCKAFVNHELCT